MLARLHGSVRKSTGPNLKLIRVTWIKAADLPYIEIDRLPDGAALGRVLINSRGLMSVMPRIPDSTRTSRNVSEVPTREVNARFTLMVGSAARGGSSEGHMYH
jgi:hypothetical protein